MSSIIGVESVRVEDGEGLPTTTGGTGRMAGQRIVVQLKDGWDAGSIGGAGGGGSCGGLGGALLIAGAVIYGLNQDCDEVKDDPWECSDTARKVGLGLLIPGAVLTGLGSISCIAACVGAGVFLCCQD